MDNTELASLWDLDMEPDNIWALLVRHVRSVATDLSPDAFISNSSLDFLSPYNQIVETATKGNMDNMSAVASNSSSAQVGYRFYKTVQLSFLCVIFVFIVTGNIAVMMAIFMSNAWRSRMNFFILHLAFADLMTGMITVVTDITWKITVEWHAGLVACRMVRFFMSIVVIASNYILVALSIDRLDAIARPMSFSGSGQRARVLVCCAWGLACIFSIPQAVIPIIDEQHGLKQCYINLPEKWHWKLYVTLLAAVLFIIPAIIISTCYIVIVVIIWSKGSLVIASRSSNTRRYASNRSSIAQKQHSKSQRTTSHESNASSRGMIPKARIKTIKMTLAIVSVFIFCWVPYFIFDLMDVYGHIPRTKRQMAVAIFIQSLTTLNSAANPIIYFIFSKTQCSPTRIRRVHSFVARIFCSCCCTRQPLSSTTCELSSNPYNEASSFKNNAFSETTSARRHSITPFVRVTLNQTENAILLKHLPKNGRPNGHSKEYNEADNLVTSL